MRLTKKALKAINVPRTRIRLALELGRIERTIVKYIDENSDNLTKAAALKVIREETGFKDVDILEDVPAETSKQVA